MNSKGCKNDDDGCLDLHCLLAAISYLLHHRKHQPRHQLQPLHSGDLPHDPLAGHVKFNVQPHDILLHEPKVDLRRRKINPIIIFNVHAFSDLEKDLEKFSISYFGGKTKILL